MKNSIMYAYTRFTRQGRFTLILSLAGYPHGYRSTQPGTAYSTGVQQWRREVKAISVSARGSAVRREISAWVTWWTFKRSMAQERLLNTFVSTSRKALRRSKLKVYVVSKPHSASAVSGPTAVVTGPSRPACFARTCRQARACMMQIDGCLYPTNIGPKI